VRRVLGKAKVNNLTVAIASAACPEKLAACLDALEVARANVDTSVPVFIARPARAVDVSDLVRNRPWATLIKVEGVPEIPQLRGAAMGAAGAGWIAVTEDIFLPNPDWIKKLLQHARPGRDVIGGSVGNVKIDLVSYAAYLTDYGTFVPSRKPDEQVTALTGSNVMYGPRVSKRASSWAAEGAWEHVIHTRLLSEGEVNLRFEPTIRVDHNETYRLGQLLAVRFDHGLHYAKDRIAENDGKSRMSRILLAPLLPPFLVLRLARLAMRTNAIRFLFATPFTLALYSAWVAGETLGYMSKPVPRGK
jgi:hypothetical protein